MKILRTLIFFVLLFVAAWQPSFSQTGKEWFFTLDEEDILETKKRTLLVILLTENQDAVKKMTKKKKLKELAKYKANIKIYNANLKAAVEKFWRFNEKIEYRTDVELESLRKEKKLSSYALLEHDIITVHLKGEGAMIYDSSTRSTLSLYIGRKKRKGIVSAVNLPSLIPIKEEFGVAMNYIQLLMDDFLAGKSAKERKKILLVRSKELSQLTLLIDKKDIEKGVTLAKLKAVYPFKIEVTTEQRINKAIWEREKGVCFLQIVPLNGTNSDGSAKTFWQTAGGPGMKTLYAQYVINAETGYFISYSTPPTFVTKLAKSRRELDENTLKDIYEKYEKSIKEDEKDAENDEIPKTEEGSESDKEADK